jgi:protein involved in polysaccharide export with SLBB domain
MSCFKASGRWRGRPRFLASALLVALALGSAPLGARQVVESRNLPQGPSGSYKIVVGDQLEITFFRTEGLNSTRVVGPDGQVHLPLVGSLQVVGRTIEELKDELTRRYAEEVVNPEITVSVSQFAGMRIYVGGEVTQPGMKDYRGELTMVQAIIMAGGFLTTASLSSVVLIRQGPNKEPVGTLVDVKEILSKAKFDRDVRLEPGDILFVPRKGIANVNLFVEQYIRNNIPIPIVLGYNIGFTN